jgi:mono/diheme cytochrome c family protein
MDSIDRRHARHDCTWPVRALAVFVIGACIVLAACSSGHEAGKSATPELTPAQQADAALVAGRRVWIDNCARCLGPAGQGGVGPKLADGKVVRDFPTVAEQVEFVRNGRGIMPAWKNLLSDEQVQDVVQFTRKVFDRGPSGQ